MLSQLKEKIFGGAKPVEVAGLPMKTFRLRWRFEFEDKSSKIGIWDNRGANEGDAARVDKTKLAFAHIEAESVLDFKTICLVSVAGAQYVTAQWQAFVIPPIGIINQMDPRTALKIKGTISGLSFMTNTEYITATVDGTVQTRKLSEKEMAAIKDLYETRSKEIKQ